MQLRCRGSLLDHFNFQWSMLQQSNHNRMLCLESMRFLSKVEGVFDRLNPPEMNLRIIIDENFIFPLLKGTTKQNQTIWDQQSFPPIQMSPYLKSYNVEFNVFRDEANIGKNVAVITYNQNQKVCIDILDADNKITGKFYFQARWLDKVETGKYLTYQKYCEAKQKSKTEGGRQAALVMVSNKKKYVPEPSDDDCGGFCCCFAVRKKKPVPPPQQIQQIQPISKPVELAQIKLSIPPTVKSVQRFKNIPYIYYEQELQQSGKALPNEEPKHLIYYSKSFVKSR